MAVDHYHRYKEDIALMAEMGLRAYRFSVSWPRVYPRGRGDINSAGLRFYGNLIDELLSHDIEPILTLYHWDVPQALMEEYGAWESRRIIEDIDSYCVTLYKHFGDRVRYWVSLNEQNYNLHHGFITSMHPPGVKDRKRFYEANHIAFLANAKAIESFRQHVPNGKIGPSFAYSPAYPLTSSPGDVLASENADAFTNEWWLDVYCWGRYPQVPFRHLCEQGLGPTIHEGDLELLQRGKPDFLGVNYYQTLTYEANPLAFCDSGVLRLFMITRSEVIPLVLDAAPSFAAPWAAYQAEPSFDNDLLYVHLGELARHLLHLLRVGAHDELRAAFDLIERLHLEGDAYVREAATIGLLESLQNNAGHAGLDPDGFLPWLKPESRRWWKGLDAFWAGKSPAVLPVDS